MRQVPVMHVSEERSSGSGRKLLWIGSPFFSGALEKEGWDVRVHNFEEPRVYGWNDVLRLAGGRPDVVVAADKSRPPFVAGMEDFPCLTVFYAVDTHIHSWYPWYAQGFDACLVSLRDHLPRMRGPYLPEQRIRWFPAFAPDLPETPPDPLKESRIDVEDDPEWDCLFVGTVDAQRTPGRKRFLEQLGRRLPLEVRRGNYLRLYPRARVVLNYCELGDLNFRVFEALGCGSCLVTPLVGHGLNELFTPGEHLLAYPPDDTEAAEAAVRTALNDPELRKRLGRNGLAAVNAAHRAGRRAEAFSAFVRELPADLPAARRKRAAEIRERGLRLLYLLQAETVSHPGLRRAYLAAAQGTFSGTGEEPTD